MPQTPAQIQHAEFGRKVALRRMLMKAHGHAVLAGAAAYVPYIGDGDLAMLLYRPLGLVILGADIEAERVETAASRLLPGSHSFVVANCETGYPFAHVPTPSAGPLALADFDAYAYPYDAFRVAWAEATWADRVTVAFTDGQRRGVKSHRWIEPNGEHRSGQGGRFTTAFVREAYNMWYAKHCRPWFLAEITLRGYRIVRDVGYVRGSGMCYWGAVIQRG